MNLSALAYRALTALAFIVRQKQEVLERYDVDLSYFMWLMRYESLNHSHLKFALQELQRTTVQQLNDDPEAWNENIWVSVPVLGLAAIQNGRFIFEMSSVVQRLLKDPEKAHWLNLNSISLTFLYARAIYNRVLIYLADGISPWIPLEVVQAWPGQGSSASLYKYFKRDSLEPAISQINERSNINIAYETQTEQGSRKVAYLRFRVSLKDSISVLGEVDALSEEHANYSILKDEIGLSLLDFKEITENCERWNANWISNAIEFTRWSILNGRVATSPASYFMQALRNNLAVTAPEKS